MTTTSPPYARYAGFYVDITNGVVIDILNVRGQLRRELQQAINAGEGEPLRFELGRWSWRPLSRSKRAGAGVSRSASG
jgi:hypothetical protein